MQPILIDISNKLSAETDLLIIHIKMAANPNPNPKIKVLEKCSVTPPPDTVTELSLPLTFYDLQWLVHPPTQHLDFYRFPHSTSHFIKTVIPSLKSSLSLVLKYFLPVAGHLICPIDSDDIPFLLYKKGDSVSLTFVESSEDFDYLVGDHQRDSYKFFDLVPQLPEPVVTSASEEVSPLLAVQVTVFPNSGIAIGRTLPHVVGDATALVNFYKSWAFINKFNGNSSSAAPAALLPASSQPLHDRSVVQDPFHLGRKIFNAHKSHALLPNKIPNPTISKDEVGSTFILHPSDIINLKRFILTKQSKLTSNNLSTFTSALIWTCFSKSIDGDEDKCDYLCTYINCRQRLDPPVPQNYFGNCVVPIRVGSNHEQLVGTDGLLVAAVAIGDAIHGRVHNIDGILRGDWMMPEGQSTDVAPPGILDNGGSMQPTVHNDADFGWGKPEKHECVSIEGSTTLVFLNSSKRFDGAFEIGISLPKKRMDAFTTAFTNYINNSFHVVRSPL